MKQKIPKWLNEALTSRSSGAHDPKIGKHINRKKAKENFKREMSNI
jgi:hypothetical protein